MESIKIGQRAVWHDYRGVGFYMLTMVTAERRPLFGQVVEAGAMVLSPMGHHVLEAWRAMPGLKYFTAKAAKFSQMSRPPHP
jgi:hypothetical protein